MAASQEAPAAMDDSPQAQLQTRVSELARGERYIQPSSFKHHGAFQILIIFSTFPASFMVSA